MSRIFDVVSKERVLDFGEMCPAETKDAKGIRTPQQEPRRPLDGPRSGSAYRVVRLRAPALSPIFPFDDKNQAAVEQYRLIRTRILHRPKKPQFIVVSSASSGDGKTVTSINVAASLALKGESRVLLVDGDLRQPRIADAVGIPIVPGLGDVLSGAAELDAAIVRAEQFPNLFILPAGNPRGSAAELLDSQNWQRLTKELRARFSNVIFDAPPIATVADYELLQLVCDGVIVVARPDHSNRTALAEGLKNIPREKLLGLVLNCVEDWWLWKTPSYGYYRKPDASETLSR
ncbi:MAG: CpsD/CapB family tyrosine-protein kinase [Acidobacteriaceae bacterium]|nr:CpsD/CapB family tyrosine-protein kinase [Acidobacteriaceae bacterium]